MTLQNLIDTLLNIWVFAFIGILVWLRQLPARGQGRVAAGLALGY